MKEKVDEYFNNGIIEMVRRGENIFQRNILSQEDYLKTINEIAAREVELKTEIDALVDEIRNDVLKCNPLQLLNFAQLQFLKSLLGITSESQILGLDNMAIARAVEYIQSIYVSCDNYEMESNKDPTELFLKINNNISELYGLISFYYIAIFATYKKMGTIDDTLLQELIEAQMTYWVRGHRYQVFELDYYKALLISHNEILTKLFNMTSDDLVEGIGKLQYSLSQGRMDPLNNFVNIIDKLQDVDEKDWGNVLEDQREKGQEFISTFFGVQLNDVSNITGWNEKFINALSFESGKYKEFFNKDKYSGWPIKDLPVHKKPFIKIGNKCYCFDYYSFSDNFYRAIQKTITTIDPNYNWSLGQQQASETMVADIMQKLLPSCKIYKNNYYPLKGSLKQLCENDLILEYYDILIIIEIKAGSFVFTAPLLDFDQHIKSYKKLIEEPENQCQRTYEYLISKQNAQLYNKDKSEKDCIEMSKIKDVFMLSVTIDNINTFASRAEKLSFLNSNCKAISIAVDDLLVYQKYFESPLKFLHFLKNRREATLLDCLVATDELDHLGMYIYHNCYSLYYSNNKIDRLNPIGFREELDTYFTQLYHPKLNPIKPIQNLPPLYEKIIKFLDNCDCENKIRISNYLLDFSSEAKIDFSNQIEQIFKHQKETGKVKVCCSVGKEEKELRYACFILQPGVQNISQTEQIDYVWSNMLWNNDNDRTYVSITFDNNEEIVNISSFFYTQKDIPAERREELFLQGKNRAHDRLQKYILEHGNKIGRNEMCPCGSGKKYKKCCGS